MIAASMHRKLHIARGGIELGTLNEAEALELLRAGFLLPDDAYRIEGTADWRTLAEFAPESESKPKPTMLMQLAKQKVVAAGEATAAQATRLTAKLRSVTDRQTHQLADSANRMLRAFTPQIRQLVSRQLVKQSVARVRASLRDDEFTRKLFGATYDCLPKPVCRFVTEETFIQFCLEHRQKLLGSAAATESSEVKPPA
jgi:hypothetical protein